MRVSRREFFGTVFSAAGAVAFSGGVPKRPNLKVGVLSDIHINGKETQKRFYEVLKYYRAQHVDAVLIAGDLTDRGIMTELQLVSDAWYAVFPDDKYPDGTPIEKVFITGNHDVSGYAWVTKDLKLRAEQEKIALANDYRGNWKKLFHEDWHYIYSKKIKGYTFIAAHWKEWYNGELERFMRNIHSELSPSQPFFYTQHAHLENTVFGPWAWGSWDDHGIGRKVMNNYPNVLALSGHSHFPLTDERNVWQGEFTSVGTSSLREVEFPYGRENGTLSEADRESQMRYFIKKPAHQGMIMNVWDHNIVFERYDFERFEKLDEDWVIPILRSKSEPRPFSFENRAKLTQAPQFPKGAKIAMEFYDGSNRKGVACKQLVLTFPAADSANWKNRVYDYEIAAEIVDYDTVKPYVTKRVFQRGIEAGAAHQAKTAQCIFSLDELPLASKSLLRFAVTPLNCYGERGRTLYADYPQKA